MKKNFKLVLALVLSIMMVLGSMTALADAKITITPSANDTAEHTYEAYQIFTGTVEDDQLKDIKWGSAGDIGTDLFNAFGSKTEETTKDNADGSAKLTVGEVFTAAKEVGTAAAYAEAIGLLPASLHEELAEKIEAAVSSSSTEGTSGSDGVSGLEPGYYLVKDQDDSLAGKENGAYTKFVLKLLNDDITVTEKAEVPSVDKTVEDKTGAYQETADHKINKTFNFKVEATIPADVKLADYDTYMVNFVDTMSEGVTFEEIVSVKVNTHEIEASGYTFNDAGIVATGGGNFNLKIADILPILDEAEKAAEVKVTVIYKAHLNEKAIISEASDNEFDDNYNKVKLEYSNNANAGGDGDTGSTPEDYVWVFSFDKKNTKYADAVGDGNELADAGFRLYDSEDNEIPVYYSEEKKAYVPVGDTGNTAVEMKSSSDDTMKGQFNIIGLDAGTYTLKETTVPTGYNAVEDITFTITTTHSENSSGNSATMELTNNDRQTDVVDKSGTTLPETGGIGTTIFYVAGSILVLAAAILLVTKRRMSAND